MTGHPAEARGRNILHKWLMPSLHAYAAPHRMIADQLRRAPAFDGLPMDRRECLEVLREGAIFEVPSGVEIVSPGDAPALLVVTEGAVCEQDGMRTWSAGSCLGIAETLANRPFVNAIRTAAPTLVYRLDAALLDSFRALCPAIAQRLLDEHAQVTHEPVGAD